MPDNKFKFSHLGSLFKDSFKAWAKDDPSRLSAVVAYYAILSIPAILVLVISIAGIFVGEQAVQGELTKNLKDLFGADTAKFIEQILSNASQTGSSVWAIVLGVGILIVSSTGVFVQLQKSLNTVWDVKMKEGLGWKKTLVNRVLSVGVIISIGFLLLVSLLLTTGLSALNEWLSSQMPQVTIYFFYVLDFILSYGLVTLLFALIFKILPDVNIEWRSVWSGALVTGLLFIVGKFLLGIYFGKFGPASTYGAAGSIVIVLLWINYSCLILFFGAEFTQVYANKYDHPIEPGKNAERTAEYKLEHQLEQQHAVT